MNGFTGRKLSFVSAGLSFFGSRGAPRSAVAGRSRMNRPIAGNSSRKFRAHGDEEYAVVAQSVAAQLRRKSTKQAAGVYGLNSRSRCCSTDHNRMLNYWTWLVGSFIANCRTYTVQALRGKRCSHRQQSFRCDLLPTPPSSLYMSWAPLYFDP